MSRSTAAAGTVIPGCQDGGCDARRPGRRAARRGHRTPRPGVRARRRGHRQDPHDHPPDRAPGQHRARRARAGAGGHVHRPGRRRDAHPAARARRRGRAGAHVPRRRAAPAALLLAARRRRRAVAAGRGQAADRRAGRGPGEVGTDAATLRDLASEIEWAKAASWRPATTGRGGRGCVATRRGPPSRWRPSTRATSRPRTRAEQLDFDDLLLHTAGALEEHADVARGVPRPLPLLRRRRVPGRHPAAAAAARRLARRARRPHRGRRRQPDDLLVRRRQPDTCWSSRGASPRPSSCGWSATTAPPRRSSAWPTRSSARPRPARGHAAAADRPAPAGSRPGFRRARRRGRRGRRGRPRIRR